MSNKRHPIPSDVVISVMSNFNGYTLFGEKRQVDKIYKNGNVVLVGSKEQFNYFLRHEGYSLSSCSGSKMYVLLNSSVESEVFSFELIDSIFKNCYALEGLLRRNKRDIVKLDANNLESLRKKLDECVFLIKGSCKS